MTTDHDGLVAGFLEQQRKLQEQCDNDPACIAELAESDINFRAVCESLSWKAGQLREAQVNAPSAIIAPVNEIFIQQWRDYEKRFSDIVTRVAMASMIQQTRETLNRDIVEVNRTGAYPVKQRELKSSYQDSYESAGTLNSDKDPWMRANNYGSEYAAALDKLIEEGKSCLLAADLDDEDEGAWDTCNGEVAWNRLKSDCSLDVSGVLRRQILAPMLLVPKAISDNVGGELFNLYDLWTDARQAYIYGTFLSSLALARAILEKLLRRFYEAEGSVLTELIKDYEQRTPMRDSSHDLHQIRLVANAVLHSTLVASEGATNPFSEKRVNRAKADLEKASLDSLTALQKIIETISKLRPKNSSAAGSKR
jgi:hypothetical protein